MKNYPFAIAVAGAFVLSVSEASACGEILAAHELGNASDEELLACAREKRKARSDSENPKKIQPATVPTRDEEPLPSGRNGYFTGEVNPAQNVPPIIHSDERSWIYALSNLSPEMEVCRQAVNLSNPVFADVGRYSDKISMVVGSGYNLDHHCVIGPRGPTIVRIQPIRPTTVYVPNGSVLTDVKVGEIKQILNSETKTPIGKLIRVLNSFRSSSLRTKNE